MTILCEIALCTFLTFGALFGGFLVGWLGGFIHGSFWGQK
jgi:hypothetical protein